ALSLAGALEVFLGSKNELSLANSLQAFLGFKQEFSYAGVLEASGGTKMEFHQGFGLLKEDVVFQNKVLLLAKDNLKVENSSLTIMN
ncbi:MAG: hypothetical protein PVG15_16335, partial [Desulfobacterales bacterium]